MMRWVSFTAAVLFASSVAVVNAQVDYETQKWTASDASVDDSFGFAVAGANSRRRLPARVEVQVLRIELQSVCNQRGA